MKKHGFTLIELLAVIVILAIIALIATPMILGVINTAKKGSAESSALGYVEAVEKAMIINQVGVTNYVAPVDGEYTIDSTGKVLTHGESTINVDFKGDIPVGTVTVEKSEVKSANLGFKSIYGYYVTYAGTKATASTTKIS